MDERDHLFRLAGHRPPDRRRSDDHVAPGLLGVLDRLPDVPAQVMTDLGATLVQNDPARAVFGDLTRLRGAAGTVVYRWFTDPRARAGYPVQDHATESRALFADLRAAAVRRDDAQAKDLVERLLRASPECEALWRPHSVGVMRSRRKRILHPEVGLLVFDCQVLVDEERTDPRAVLAGGGHTDSGASHVSRFPRAPGQFRLQHVVVGPGVPLAEARWVRTEPLFPERAPMRGGRRRDHREVIDAIAWTSRTGCQYG
ncbi:hypothetical protein GCM10018793_67450 [Streptomyces sulfonofaciens]|uniref:MmyB-like transcription regulator ligand binding domain-containing protein n=1 Tax=Streptomyces sulfonofaciens TaxID=68272 RepID=A0A919LAU5_9ACTN|nr:transposase [Streptomyces sulfonofaciens]GHH88286.1 hypothetical protein GCM10018793_67450 [Streptomyces sulfonofaciens]